MAVIRRNPGLFSGLGVLIALLALGWYFWPAPRTTLAQGEPAPLDEVSAAQLARLRVDAALDDDVLAALDATQPQLEAVLTALRSWYDEHVQGLTSTWTALGDAQARIRALESAVALGTDESAALASARQELAQLEAGYQTTLAALRTTCLTGLDETQLALVERMRLQRGLPMPYRAIALDAAQQAAWRAAAARYQQRLAVARTADRRAALESAYAQELADVLGGPGMQTLTALRGYLGAASARVVAACQTVLPTGTEG